jgi:hypothetical protein
VFFAILAKTTGAAKDPARLRTTAAAASDLALFRDSFPMADRLSIVELSCARKS